MENVFQTNSLTLFKEYQNTFKNFSSSYPEQICAYIWNSSQESMDMYFTPGGLVSPEGEADNFLRTIGVNSFGGLVCFPREKSISGINKQELASAIVNKLNALAGEDSLYTYSILANTLAQDTTKNATISYLSTFPVLNIIETPESKHSFLHIHFCEEQNVLLVALSCEGDNTFKVEKQAIIDILCETFFSLA